MLTPPQTRSIDLPSDSSFAVAMRSQQEAERAEQQRIKSLVLNYDLTDDQHDGEEPAFHYIQKPNSTRTVLVGKGSLNPSLKPRHTGQPQRSTSSDENNSSEAAANNQSNIVRHDSFADDSGPIDHPHSQPRQDKAGNTRVKQRARKLQLGDIDWYGDRSRSATPTPPASQTALDSFIKEKPSQRGRRAGGGQRSRTKG